MTKLFLTISILSSDRRLLEILQAVTPNSDDVEITYNYVASPDQLPPQTSILVDAMSKTPLEVTTMLGCAEKYILVSDDQELITAAAESKKLFDIWLPACPAALFKLRLHRLVEQLVLAHRHYIASSIIDATINSLPDLIWIKDRQGLHLKVNDAFSQTVDKPKENIEGQDHFHIWNISREEYENSDYVCVDTDEVVVQNRKSGVFDEKVATPHGLRQFNTYKAPISDECGNIVLTVGVAQDVTEIKNMSVMFDMMLNNMPFAIMIKNITGRIIHLNAKFSELCNCEKSDYLQKDFTIGEILKRQNIEAEIDAGEHTIQMIKNDEKITLKYDIFPMNDFFNNIIGYFYMYRDITASQLYENQLRKYAYTDTLTTLYTRRYLYEYLDQSENHRRYYFILMDIDNFKTLNDTCGHQYGDEVLYELSRVLRLSFPTGIPVRMGGDEFFLLQPYTKSPARLKKHLDEFMRHVNELTIRLKRNVNVSVSIGVTSGYCSSSEELHKFTIQCDRALYQIKHAGKNSYAFYTQSNIPPTAKS